MSWLLWAWGLSVAGAALFFGAGALFAMRRMARTADDASDAIAAFDAERRLADAEEEIAQVRTEMNVAHSELATSRAELANATAALGATATERDRLASELRQARRSTHPEPPVMPAGRTRGDALRSILERETRGPGVAGAVIADELGLVVASTGEYGDALAAFGAYLADVGSKTRGVLPLHEVRQVIVQDDHHMTLTVRPLASADDNLALVTLSER
jgi:predicted regulator of Ras-like GTPase activity (Roadblock/LC7/MglB family)